ncbi:MAG: hypothetical protein HY812_14195 [Planctomycetes bacterium]|nr:hypothetical protein [Planctomycetota bacterium]
MLHVPFLAVACLALAQDERGPAVLSNNTHVFEAFVFEVTEETAPETRAKLEAVRQAALGRPSTLPLRMTVELEYSFFSVTEDGEEKGEKKKKKDEKNLVILTGRRCDFFGFQDARLSWEDREQVEGFFDPCAGLLTQNDEFKVEIGQYAVDPETGTGEFWFIGPQEINGVQFDDCETFALRPKTERKAPSPLAGKPHEVLDPRSVRHVHLRAAAGVNQDLTNEINARGPDGAGLYDRLERAAGEFDDAQFLLAPVEIVIDYYYASIDPRVFGMQATHSEVIAPQRKLVTFPGIAAATFTGKPEEVYHGAVVDAGGVEVGRLRVNHEVPESDPRFDFVEFEFLADYVLGQGGPRPESFRKGDVIVFRRFNEELIGS